MRKGVDMTGEQKRFGELLLEALEEMDAKDGFSSVEIEAGAQEVSRLLAQARREIDEEDASAEQKQALVTEGDIVDFLEEGKALTHEQQRLLFADRELRDLFRDLKRRRSIALPSRGGERAATGPAVVEMPALIAAATDDSADFERRFAGGTLKINPVGIDAQVYVVFSFDDAAVISRALIVERSRDERIERLDLPPSDDGEIVLIKDLAVPADAELVALLRDPTATGAFLR
jgi:hypothetical protein